MTPDAAAEEVLAFWFGAPDAPDYGAKRECWFKADPGFDAEIRRRFGALHARAAAGGCESWAGMARSCLALIVLLDQFSRNIYRDDPQAFAADPRALALAQVAVERGFDRTVPGEMRKFFYLPFEHSERIEDQRRSLDLFASITDTEDPERQMAYARRHHAIIERFGRFPHRNAALGRASTPEEEDFLKQPDSGF